MTTTSFRIAHAALFATLLAGVPNALPAATMAGTGGAYPTEAELQYGLACVARNGDTPLAVRRCACALDQLQLRLSFDDFQAARTVAALSTMGGERARAISGTVAAGHALDRFVHAQRAANAACF